jgi:hypothetical protein
MKRLRSNQLRVLSHAFRPSQDSEYMKLSEKYGIPLDELMEYRLTLTDELRAIATESLLGRGRYDTYCRWTFLGTLLQKENLHGKYLPATKRRTVKKGKR